MMNLTDLQGTVSDEVLILVVDTSERLRDLGIRHALVGGLAVGLHGHVRATKDVDFLVGPEAFEQTEPLLVYRQDLTPLVAMGVGKLDLMAAVGDPDLEAAVRTPARQGDIPVVTAEILVKMKLEANRPQDRADISALLAKGLDAPRVEAWLQAHAPELLNAFRDLASASRRT